MIKKPDLTAMAQEIDGHLRAVRQVMQRPVENAVVQSGLTGPQVNVLQVLAGGDGKSLKELRKALGLAHSTVSGIVDRLEKHGTVTRRADPEDGRIIRVYLTPAVHHYIHHAILSARLHPLMRALDALKPAQRATVLEGVRLLRRILDSSKATPA